MTIDTLDSLLLGTLVSCDQLKATHGVISAERVLEQCTTKLPFTLLCRRSVDLFDALILIIHRVINDRKSIFAVKPDRLIFYTIHTMHRRAANNLIF